MCLNGEPGGDNAAKNPKLDLAKMLHECIRGSVANYTEWPQLEEKTRNVFMVQAEALISTFVMLPYDDTSACSGCRTCTEALDRLDCARRDFIAVLEEARMLRGALAGLIGASEKDELEKMELMMRAMPAPDADKAAAINGIHALLKVVHSGPAKPVEVDLSHEECGYCAFSTVYPPVCAGHPEGPTACPGFKGADVC